MKPVLVFEHASKRYAPHLERSQSFMDVFVNRWRPRSRQTPAEIWVVRDLSLTIDPGEAVGIIGDNGTGKSTVLKLAARIIEPTSGHVALSGRVGALLEVGVGFHPDLTGRENVYLSGAIIGLSRSEMNRRFDDIVAFSGVEAFIDMPVRHYSSGMLVRLGFSVATSVEPNILLVDEVLSVGDYAFRASCLARIDNLRHNGTAILFVSHNLDEVRNICDRAIWLHDALVADEGPTDQVVRAYTNYNLRARGLTVTDLGDQEHRGRQFGDGGLQILGCVPLDIRGHELETVVNGEPLVLRIDYRCQRVLQRVVFGVSIYTEDGVRVVGTDSETYTRVDEKRQASIYLVFPEFALRPGRYELTVAAHDPSADNYRPYVHHHRAYVLRITPGREQQEAFVKLPARWVTEIDEVGAVAREGTNGTG